MRVPLTTLCRSSRGRLAPPAYLQTCCAPSARPSPSLSWTCDEEVVMDCYAVLPTTQHASSTEGSSLPSPVFT